VGAVEVEDESEERVAATPATAIVAPEAAKPRREAEAAAEEADDVMREALVAKALDTAAADGGDALTTIVVKALEANCEAAIFSIYVLLFLVAPASLLSSCTPHTHTQAGAS
jgi:hypothetical protein